MDDTSYTVQLKEGTIGKCITLILTPITTDERCSSEWHDTDCTVNIITAFLRRILASDFELDNKASFHTMHKRHHAVWFCAHTLDQNILCVPPVALCAL